MSDSGLRSTPDYRQEIVGSLTPVRPLPTPARRVWMLVPLGLLLSITAPLLAGQRGDLGAYAPLVTWGLTGLQSLLGLWLLALGLREAVPGQNVSWRALAFAAVLTAVLVGGVTVMTNSASATIVPPGREWQYLGGVRGLAAGDWSTVHADRDADGRPRVPDAPCHRGRVVRNVSRGLVGCRLATELLDFGANAYRRLAWPCDARVGRNGVDSGRFCRFGALEEASFPHMTTVTSTRDRHH